MKKELKQRGLSTLGNKGELTERLCQAMTQNKTDDGSVADSVDELIDEDEVLNVRIFYIIIILSNGTEYGVMLKIHGSFLL